MCTGQRQLKCRGNHAFISSDSASGPRSAPSASASPSTSDAGPRLASPRWSRTLLDSTTIDRGAGGSTPSAVSVPSPGATTLAGGVAASAAPARYEVSLEEFQQRLLLPCAGISRNDAGHAAHPSGVPPSWLPLHIVTAGVMEYTDSQEQESDTDCSEQDEEGAVDVEDCGDCEEMVASFHRASDDNIDAQQHPDEWGFPCADEDEGHQLSAAYMVAFPSDLSDLMEL
eukprot:Tamp_09501.p1 GENE.Tamp_09501~~Tamp_09501.p1  ORF type:complete len:228 (+),score=39.52 Tamp_09501:629-1312(+)